MPVFTSKNQPPGNFPTMCAAWIFPGPLFHCRKARFKPNIWLAERRFPCRINTLPWPDPAVPAAVSPAGGIKVNGYSVPLIALLAAHEVGDAGDYGFDDFVFGLCVQRTEVSIGILGFQALEEARRAIPERLPVGRVIL